MEHQAIMPLRTAQDCVDWTEKVVNEVTKEAPSISQANSRMAGVKTILGIQKLLLEYKRLVFRAGGGGEVNEMPEFFASKPKALEGK